MNYNVSKAAKIGHKIMHIEKMLRNPESLYANGGNLYANGILPDHSIYTQMELISEKASVRFIEFITVYKNGRQN